MANPPNHRSVRIVSGGCLANTMVYVDDQPLYNVVAIRWEIDTNHGTQDATARLWMEMVGVDVELAAELDQLEIRSYDPELPA